MFLNVGSKLTCATHTSQNSEDLVNVDIWRSYGSGCLCTKNKLYGVVLYRP